MTEFVAFDVETTGLSPKTDRIIEIGAVRFTETGKVLDKLEIFADPGMRIPIAIQRLTGISDDDLIDQIVPAEAVGQLLDFCAGALIVAHGAMFDVAYCRSAVPDAFRNATVLDTLELARILLPMAASHSLPTLAPLLEIEHTRPHRAFPDADATRQLLVRLIEEGAQLPSSTLASMRGLLLGTSDSLRVFFDEVVPGNGVSDHSTPASMATETVVEQRFASNGQHTQTLEQEVVALLSPDGALARSSERYEYRDAQVEMARAVTQTLERSRTILVEAGTGTGKSLAYLAPLMLWTKRNKSRAVVATRTITLQEQLASNDANQLNQLLDEPVRVAMLKGRHHYISLRRWERFLRYMQTIEPSPEMLRFALKLIVWLEKTATGDRSEIKLSATEQQFWQYVMSDTDDCLGAACSNWRTESCFMVKARRAAAAADVVITNHALLLAASERQGAVLGDFQALVIDEGHRLEESATNQMGTKLTAADILVTVQRPETAVLAEQLVHRLVDNVKRLFGDVKGFVSTQLGTDNPGNGIVELSDEMRESHDFVTIRHAAEALTSALRDAELQLEESVATASEPAEIESLSAALRDHSLNIQRTVLERNENTVCWLELKAEQAELHSAPIDVASTLEKTIFERVNATVITSATLRVGNSFDFTRYRLGLKRDVDELALELPFDYLSQALCLIVDNIPPYDAAEYDAALAKLISNIGEQLDGRTLGLFTGYGPLRRVASGLERHFDGSGIGVLAQGIDGTRRQILESFRAEPRSVLCGTSTFWEGIDLPGDVLQCVVIAKLPFPVPTDPLVRARSSQLSEPFRQYFLPVAILRLRQGFGRLIRHRDDRGAVVICDQRLLERDYARQFLEALPPAAMATASLSDAPSAVSRFVARGEVPKTAIGSQFARQSRADSHFDEEPA